MNAFPCGVRRRPSRIRCCWLGGVPADSEEGVFAVPTEVLLIVAEVSCCCRGSIDTCALWLLAWGDEGTEGSLLCLSLSRTRRLLIVGETIGDEAKEEDAAAAAAAAADTSGTAPPPKTVTESAAALTAEDEMAEALPANDVASAPEREGCALSVDGLRLPLSPNNCCCCCCW